MMGVAPQHFFHNGVLALSYFAWPTFVGAVFRTFDCNVRVREEDTGRVLRFVASDAKVSCDTGGYEALRVGAVLACLAALALPAGIVWFLKKHEDRLFTDDRFKSRYLFLYGGFKPKYFWWEVRDP